MKAVPSDQATIDLGTFQAWDETTGGDPLLVVDRTGNILFRSTGPFPWNETGSDNILANVLPAEQKPCSKWLFTIAENEPNGRTQVSTIDADHSVRVYTFTALRCTVGTQSDCILLIGNEKTAENGSRFSPSNPTQQTAETVAELKANLVGNIGHELRTPLNGILGAVGVLSDSSTGREQSDMLRCINDAAKSLEKTVSELTAYESVAHGFWEFTEQTFDLIPLLDSIRSEYAPEAEAKGLQFTTAIEPLVPPRLYGDVKNLRQIIRILVGNAIKFTECGVVSVQVLNRGVDPTAAAVVIEVFDTGIGIDQDALAWICDPFRQSDSSCSRNHAGLGLGLALCQLLAIRMGTRLNFESSTGEGSRFWVPFRFGISA